MICDSDNRAQSRKKALYHLARWRFQVRCVSLDLAPPIAAAKCVAAFFQSLKRRVVGIDNQLPKKSTLDCIRILSRADSCFLRTVPSFAPGAR